MKRFLLSTILATVSTVAAAQDLAEVKPKTDSGLRATRDLKNHGAWKGDGGHNNGRQSRVTHFLSNFNSGQETKECRSGAFGNAYATVIGNTFCVSVSFTPFSSDWTKAHFHGPAGPGDDGEILIDYSDSVDLSSSYFSNCTEIDSSTKHALNKGWTYFNMHTVACESGEIRGQLVPAFVGKVRVDSTGMTVEMMMDEEGEVGEIDEIKDIFGV